MLRGMLVLLAAVDLMCSVFSLSSQVLTLDLKAYDGNTGAGAGSQAPPSPISSVGGGGVGSKTSTPSRGSVVSAGEYRQQLQQQQLGKRRGAGDAVGRRLPQPLYRESIAEGDEDEEE